MQKPNSRIPTQTSNTACKYHTQTKTNESSKLKTKEDHPQTTSRTANPKYANLNTSTPVNQPSIKHPPK